MDAPEVLEEIRPIPGGPATREDFPYSLQAYAASGAGVEPGEWSLFLYRATDAAERAWLLANGFTLHGRLWVRTAAEHAEGRGDVEHVEHAENAENG